MFKFRKANEAISINAQDSPSLLAARSLIQGSGQTKHVGCSLENQKTVIISEFYCNKPSAFRNGQNTQLCHGAWSQIKSEVKHQIMDLDLPPLL